MFAMYVRLNATHPLTTKSVVSAVLLGAGDVACQQYESSRDGHRTLRMASWGLIINGPTGHAFYAALERLVRTSGARAVALKIAIDQFVYTPPITAGFFAYNALLSGSSASEALEVARHETGATLLYNWCFWGLAHVATFSIIPVEHRVAWVALKNFAWSGFLSWRLSSLKKTDSAVPTDAPPKCA
jgi:protein Mpv17